jgi:hypothetical protein
MLPADTGGKINYSPGTFRPVRKFDSCAARHGRNQNEALCVLRVSQALTRSTLSLSVTSVLKLF